MGKFLRRHIWKIVIGLILGVLTLGTVWIWKALND